MEHIISDRLSKIAGRWQQGVVNEQEAWGLYYQAMILLSIAVEMENPRLVGEPASGRGSQSIGLLFRIRPQSFRESQRDRLCKDPGIGYYETMSRVEKNPRFLTHAPTRVLRYDFGELLQICQGYREITVRTGLSGGGGGDPG